MLRLLRSTPVSDELEITFEAARTTDHDARAGRCPGAARPGALARQAERPERVA